jgi:hypothetical protein
MERVTLQKSRSFIPYISSNLASILLESRQQASTLETYVLYYNHIIDRAAMSIGVLLDTTFLIFLLLHSAGVKMGRAQDFR